MANSQQLFRFDVFAAIADNHAIPCIGPARLLGEHHLRLFGAVGHKLAVLLFLDIAVMVFDQQVFEQMVPLFADALGGAGGIAVQILAGGLGILEAQLFHLSGHLVDIFHKLAFPLQLRKWQVGDRFHPLGMKGSKLLSDFFVDQKMGTHQKEECQVLTTSDDRIVWVVGRRIDDRFKVTDETKTILVIRMM